MTKTNTQNSILVFAALLILLISLVACAADTWEKDCNGRLVIASTETGWLVSCQPGEGIEISVPEIPTDEPTVDPYLPPVIYP